MSNLKISVVVPGYNCAATIAKTLKALTAQEIKSDIEIIFVDDGSTDKTADIIKSFPQVQYVYQDNAGPATARNRGVELATGDVVFFTDSDCVPRLDWIAKILPHFNDEKIAIVAGSYGIANPQEPLAQCIQDEILYRHSHLMPDYPKVFGSYNFCVRKKVFAAVGGFDTSYRFASGEDNDLSYKLLKSGHKIYFEREALVDHHHTHKTEKYLREQFRHGYWRAKMYLQHPQMSKGDDYTFWKDAVETVVVLMMLVFLVLAIAYPNAMIPFLLLLIFLINIEIIFSMIMIKNLVLIKFYWVVVMFLRAFARTFGFIAGGCRFLLRFSLKR